MSKDKKKCDSGLIALWMFIGVLLASLVSLVLALCVFNHQITFLDHKIKTSKINKENSPDMTNMQTTEEGWMIVGSTKLLSEMAQKKSFLLYIGKTSCPACQEFVPLLKSAYDESGQPEVFYYDTDKAKHKKTVLRTLNVDEVPSLIYIKKGEVFDRLDNTADQNAIKVFLEKYKK